MDRRVWRHYDLLLALATLLLVLFGLAMIYSATYERSGPGVDPLVYRQAMYAAAGLVVFLALSAIDYRILIHLSWPLYAGGCFLLLVVLALGRVTHGSQRWIQVGLIEFQPSELVKLCVIFALGKYLASNVDHLKSPKVVLGSILIPGIPFVLVQLQPDFGTATVYVATWLAMLLVAGVPRRYFAAFFGTAVTAAPAVWFAMPPYQKLRISTFLNPQSDPLGAGYNVIQAQISVGSGEFWGRGFLSGSQSQLHFLSVQYADFIFSVLAEEFGFVGATVLVLLFTLIFIRGFRAANRSQDRFGFLVTSGIVAMIAYEVIVNVGMNVGLLPVTGVPLPMISYGGTSLVTFMGALGILESVTMRHRKFGF